MVVSIEVEDVNDNSPQFINEPYATVIIEVCVLIQYCLLHCLYALELRGDGGGTSTIANYKFMNSTLMT